MEESYSESKPSSVPFILVKLLFSPFSWSGEGTSNELQSVQKFLVGVFFFVFSRLGSFETFTLCEHETKNQLSRPSSDNDKENVTVSSKEVEEILQTLGFLCSKGEGSKETVSSEKLSEMFNEEEASMEEVKEAFEVYDKNGDGFIDAEELQRVMVMLRLEEGFSLERCEEMIRKFDQNCDGRIDFDEFVRFMETSFC